MFFENLDVQESGLTAAISQWTDVAEIRAAGMLTDSRVCLRPRGR